MISQGEICWGELSPARRSEPEFRRPVLVVQSDAFNRSRIAMVVCVLLTSKVKWALMPGNVTLSAKVTGLPKNSVENVSNCHGWQEHPAGASRPITEFET